MKKQGGFTLIELVVVIVILGILAVTAAPKFLNLQDDAKVSTIKGLAGAMKGAAGITYGKAAVQGLDAVSTAQSMKIDENTSVMVINGYPTATSAGIGAVVDGLGADGDFIEVPNTAASTDPASISYGYNNFDCVATYTEAADRYTPATVKVELLNSNSDIQSCSLDSANNN